jgi:hypothetical protein
MSVFYNVLMEKSASKRLADAYGRFIETGHIGKGHAKRLKRMFGEDVLEQGSEAQNKARNTMQEYMDHDEHVNPMFMINDPKGISNAMRRERLEAKLRENFGQRGSRGDEYAGYTTQFDRLRSHSDRKRSGRRDAVRESEPAASATPNPAPSRISPETERERLRRISEEAKAGRFGELSADDQHFVMTYTRKNLSPSRIEQLKPEAASRIMETYRARNVLGPTESRLRGEGIDDMSALSDQEALQQHFYDYGTNADNIQTNVQRQLGIEKLKERLGLNPPASAPPSKPSPQPKPQQAPTAPTIFPNRPAEGTPQDYAANLLLGSRQQKSAPRPQPSSQPSAQPSSQPSAQPSSQPSPQQQSNLKRNLLLAGAGLTTAGGAGYMYHRRNKKRSEQR